MKKALLYLLLLLYLAFVSMEFLTASRIVLLPPTNFLRLTFSLGWVIWIHLAPKDTFEAVDFDFIRIFLVFMFVTDFILGTFGTIEGPTGRLSFIIGIAAATFGQFALILRHLRLTVFDRTHAIGGISLDITKRTQIRYFIIFVLVEILILSVYLASGSTDSFPYVAFYVFISLVSLVSAFLYLLSRNQTRSRLLAFSGLLLLIISDSFTGLGISILKDWPYLTLAIWATYAPVLLLIAASILNREPTKFGGRSQGRPSMPNS